jgi:SAM-dependent methyltransferase
MIQKSQTAAYIAGGLISRKIGYVRQDSTIYNSMRMRHDGDTKSAKSGEGFSYNGEVGHWWRRRSLETAHRRAYAKIADFIRASYSQAPRLIVDYACGAGNLLSLLSHRFPHSKLVGLDGSSLMLSLARQRLSNLPRHCAQRISLVETALPNFALSQAQADLVVFCFPHMMPYSSEVEMQDWRAGLDKKDREIALNLAYPEDPFTLEQSRYVALNLRHLLIRGGICVRVEYASLKREALSLPELLRVSFEEGSLDTEVEGRMPRQWFHLLASAYFRSKVLEDVYQQTGDERDRNGGFIITVLKAI